MYRKMKLFGMLFMFVFSVVVPYGIANAYSTDITTKETIKEEQEKKEREKEENKDKGKEEKPAANTGSPLNLTMKGAVELGLKNSIDLKSLENDAALSLFKIDRASTLRDKLMGGINAYNAAQAQITSGQKQIAEAQAQIDQATEAINNGLAPTDITVAAGLVIPAKANILAFLKAIGKESLAQTVIDGVKSEIASQQAALDAKKAVLLQSQSVLEAKSSELDTKKALIGSVLADKLDISEVDNLEGESAGALLMDLANAYTNVLKAAYGIYENKIAMLIEKNYLDVLKAKKLLEVKGKAVARAEIQYDFAKDGYENGMKARDDMLMAQIYLTGTRLENRKAQEEYRNALAELKKNLNVDLNTDIVLQDVLAEKPAEYNLTDGMTSAKSNRLEMLQATQENNIYRINHDFVEDDYGVASPRLIEAQRLLQRSAYKLDKTWKDVSTEVYQSYETMNATGEMLVLSKDMVQQAKENLEIVQYRYREGFGAESSLLKKMDLEASAGTIIEVLAAEENLAQVEEKVIEIMYGYTLAKAKYLNDCGLYII